MREFDLNNPQGKKIRCDRMKVFTIDLTLNLLLPLVVLTHTTTCSSESMDSFILNLLHTNTHVYDFVIPLKGFRSSTVIDLLQQLQIYRFQRCIDGILVVTFKGKVRNLLDLKREPPMSLQNVL